MSIFLSLDKQHRITVYTHIMSAISTSLNIFSLYLLIAKTPPSQAAVRNYLIYIQIILTMIDLNMELLFHPIPIFPAMAGYGLGLFIRAGVPMILEVAITVFLYSSLGASFILITLFRHQAIVRDNKNKKVYNTIKTIIILVPFLALFLGIAEHDITAYDRVLFKDARNISWIRDRGSYIAMEVSDTVHDVLLGTTIAITIAVLFAICVFAHMFYALSKQTSKRSRQTIRAIRQSLVALTIQLGIPFWLFSIPGLLCIFGLLFQQLFSFETIFAGILILPFHSVAHNFILVMGTPAYRNFLFAHILRKFWCNEQVVNPSKVELKTVQSFARVN